MLNMDDGEHELRKKEYDRSITEGILPYDVNIDAYPVEDRPTPERHAYIAWSIGYFNMGSQRVVQVVHMATTDTPRRVEPDLTRSFHVQEAELIRRTSQKTSQVNLPLKMQMIVRICPYLPLKMQRSLQKMTSS